MKSINGRKFILYEKEALTELFGIFFLAELNVHIDQCMWPIYFDQTREIENLKNRMKKKKKKLKCQGFP